VTILPPMEQATLKALADACNYSLRAHVPTEAVTCRVAKNLRGEAKHALKELRKKGLCLKHPTGGSTTWQLTPEGLTIAGNI
jgi:hypothetical protein